MEIVESTWHFTVCCDRPRRVHATELRDPFYIEFAYSTQKAQNVKWFVLGYAIALITITWHLIKGGVTSVGYYVWMPRDEHRGPHLTQATHTHKVELYIYINSRSGPGKVSKQSGPKRNMFIDDKKEVRHSVHVGYKRWLTLVLLHLFIFLKKH